MLAPELTLPLFMERFEALLDLLDEHRLVYWLDWGTLLGYHRQRNVIPWDYDVDLCLLKPDYDALMALFGRSGNKIGALVLDPEYYGEPGAAAFLPLPEDPERYHGFDLVAYAREAGVVRSLMSPQLIAWYPADYDFAEDEVFPLHRGHLLGRRVLTMRKGEERLSYYGDWRALPPEQPASVLTTPPFRELERASSMGSGTQPTRGETTSAKGYESAAELGRGGHFAKTTPGVDTLWIVAPAELEALRARGVEAGSLEGQSFTSLVFLEEKLLWGRLYVDSIAQGEALFVPPGSWVAVRPSHPTRFEEPALPREPRSSV